MPEARKHIEVFIYYGGFALLAYGLLVSVNREEQESLTTHSFKNVGTLTIRADADAHLPRTSPEVVIKPSGPIFRITAEAENPGIVTVDNGFTLQDGVIHPDDTFVAVEIDLKDFEGYSVEPLTEMAVLQGKVVEVYTDESRTRDYFKLDDGTYAELRTAIHVDYMFLMNEDGFLNVQMLSGVDDQSGADIPSKLNIPFDRLIEIPMDNLSSTILTETLLEDVENYLAGVKITGIYQWKSNDDQLLQYFVVRAGDMYFLIYGNLNFRDR